MTWLKNNNIMIIIVVIITILLVLITCLKPKYEAYCGVNRDVVEQLLSDGKFRKLKNNRRQCRKRTEKSCGSKINCEFYKSRKERKENVQSPIRKYLEEQIQKKSKRSRTRTQKRSRTRTQKRSKKPLITIPNSTLNSIPNSTTFNNDMN